MTGSQSVTIQANSYYSPELVKVGERIRVSKKSFIRRLKRVKTKEMVWRMKGKEFRPIFIVTSVNRSIPNQISFNMKPYNF